MSFIDLNKQKINEVRIVRLGSQIGKKNNSNKVWEEIVTLQHTLNKAKAGEDYLAKNLPQNAAVIGEASELLISSAYEWWKNVSIDKQNMITEAIDLLHFLVSQALQDNSYIDHEECFIDKVTQIISDAYKEVITKSGIYFSSRLLKEDVILLKEEDENYIQVLRELLIPISQELIYSGNYMSYRFEALFAIFGILGLDIDDIHQRYLVKNCLNQFRKDHGYKQGTYVKYHNSNKRIKGNNLRGITEISLFELVDLNTEIVDRIEDNDLALAIAQRTSVDENDENNNTLYKALYNNLEDVYKQLI